MQHVTSLSFLLLAYSNYLSHANKVVPCGETTATPALLKHLAKRQVDYILGDNPLGMSYMVGYGPRYPRRIHHRASSLPSVAVHPARIGCKAGSRYFFSPNPNPNVLVGAVVGGPSRIPGLSFSNRSPQHTSMPRWWAFWLSFQATNDFASVSIYLYICMHSMWSPKGKRKEWRRRVLSVIV
ncbi:hypothetical protein LR48_Vigan325s000400 [Vigna angularis]|uniref:Endoglucanase n=1 Tax=Phaseolus angularis TaxID=3914 RepID=A0A0L9T8D6_PHAAN|nr:hypothetical protein LR48_Vigan325s000400 [Vigna angularis]